MPCCYWNLWLSVSARMCIISCIDTHDTDLMLCEVLQGLESEQAARDVEALLRRFEIVSMAGDAIGVAGLNAGAIIPH